VQVAPLLSLPRALLFACLPAAQRPVLGLAARGALKLRAVQSRPHSALQHMHPHAHRHTHTHTYRSARTYTLTKTHTTFTPHGRRLQRGCHRSLAAGRPLCQQRSEAVRADVCRSLHAGHGDGAGVWGCHRCARVCVGCMHCVSCGTLRGLRVELV